MVNKSVRKYKHIKVLFFTLLAQNGSVVPLQLLFQKGVKNINVPVMS